MAGISNNTGIRRELTFLQQNLNKPHTGQHNLISSGKLIKEKIDIIALQEPAIYFLGETIVSRDWIPLYPSAHEKDPKKMRVISIISNKLPKESWEQPNFPPEDVVAIKIT